MEIQFHPASRGARVRMLRIGSRGERWLAGLCFAGALLAASLVFTAPAVLLRARERARPGSASEAAEARARREGAARPPEAILERALDRADYLNRIAFVYGVTPVRWLRALGSQAGSSSTAKPQEAAAQVEPLLPALEKARAILEERERSDPDVAARSPSLLPCALCEPSSFFGPRVSPWTGEEESVPGSRRSRAPKRRPRV